MTDQLLEVLRTVDPARTMPADADVAREVIRERILATTVAGTQDRPADAARGVHTRRRMLVVIAAALIAVIPLGGWTYYSYFTDRATVLREFRSAQPEMPLPAGATWTTPDLPNDAVYGSKYGYIEAWTQSTHAWMREWLTAHDAGDSAREQEAIAAIERQIGLQPLHRDGDPEEAGGFDQSAVDHMQSLLDQMKAGDATAIEEYLQVHQADF